MILKITVIGLVSTVVWVHGAYGASYSKVYVQNGGPDVLPVEYYSYGAPPVITNPQIARLSAPPVGSVVPVKTVPKVVPPCVSPCIIPGPGVAPAAPSAKFISYNQNVPVAVAPNKDNGYEYSYVVYDENTGDRKAQRELSDGAVVRGEYSFLQPDGYVREVQYRADDLTGFNVVVKRILPEAIGGDKKSDKGEPAPCPIKHEDLKVEGLPEKEDIDHRHDHSHDGHGHGPGGHDYSAEGLIKHPDHEHNVNTPTDKAVQVVENIEVHEPQKESESVTEHVEPPQPEIKQAPEPVPEQKPESQQTTEALVEKVDINNEIPAVTHQSAVEVVDLPAETPPNVLISYEDVLRCLQAKGQGPKGLNFSPLSYIVLPANNRPC